MSESQFYSRATGKFKRTSNKAYTSNIYSRKDRNSIYSLENEEDNYGQIPMGTLSITQIKFIKEFLIGMCSRQDIDIDPYTRSIHLVNSWKSADNITLTCTILQPHISNCMVQLSGLTCLQAQSYADIYFSEDRSLHPTFTKTFRYCQAIGKRSIPFVDTILEKNLIPESNISWNMSLLTEMQLIFCIAYTSTLYECKLTHASCKVLMDAKLPFVNISPPETGKHNYSFRSDNLRQGGGTGACLTVHSAGTMQYQGKPQHIIEVVSSFRQSLDHIMLSKDSMKFLRSLAILRELPIV